MIYINDLEYIVVVQIYPYHETKKKIEIIKWFYFNAFKIGFLKLLVGWVECSPMVRETGFQSQVASNQRL